MKKLVLFVLAAVLLLSAGQVSAKASLSDKTAAVIAAEAYRGYLLQHGFSPKDVHLYIVGQSHLDAAWLWRKQQTREKAYLTFQMAVKNMDEYPNYRFTASSAVYYEWVKEDHPDLYAKILKYAKEGRWEITGGMWVEPDCNAPEGESYIRQRLIGMRYFKEEFGHMPEVEWLLDTFGYSANLPQILARSGGKYFYTSKLTWNDTTIFPFHFFKWQSPDGSQVVSSITGMNPFFPTDELARYKSARYLLKPGTTLVANYTTPPEQIKAAMSDDLIKHFMLIYGKGDGGMGPIDIEVALQREKERRGLGQITTIQSYFDDIDKLSDRFPVWDTEMYLEYHRGTLTTHSWIKRANRLGESLMRTTEGLRSGLTTLGVDYPYTVIKSLWKLFLLNQFHDILPGSSIPEVYIDARADHDQIQEGLRNIIDEGLAALAKKVKTAGAKDLKPVIVYNPLAWSRAGLVEVEIGNEKLVAADASGKALPSQVVVRSGRNFLAFRAADVPSMGYSVYYLKTGEPGVGSLSVNESDAEIVLDNGITRVAVNKNSGLISSLKKAGGKELMAGGGNRLLSYADFPKDYPAWNIDPNYLQHPIALPADAEVKLTAKGPLFAEVSVKRSVTVDGKTTTFNQAIRLADGDPQVYLDFDADYHLENALTKVEFGTAIDAPTVAADGAYCVVERPTVPQTASEKARWEMYMLKWIDLATAANGGLAVLNNGKYGFSIDNGRALRVTLVKAAKHPNPWGGSYDVYHPKPGEYIYTDQGPQRAELALLPHDGDWKTARIWAAGYEFNTPLVAAVTDAHDGSLPTSGAFFTLESATGYIASVKKAEDDGDLVVRIVEASGGSGPATLKLGMGKTIESASETDLLEFEGQPLTVKDGAVTIDLGPYQIRTIKIKVK